MFSKKNDIWSKSRGLRDSPYNNIYVRRLAWTFFAGMLLVLVCEAIAYAIYTM